MSPRLTIRGWGHLVLAISGLFLALAVGEPVPALLALPSGLLLTYSLASGVGRSPEVELELSRERTIEGIPVDVTVTVPPNTGQVGVELNLPEGLQLDGVAGGRQVGESGIVMHAAGGGTGAVLTLIPRRWGTFEIARLGIHCTDTFGILSRVMELAPRQSLVVLPATEEVDRLVEPFGTNLHSGDVRSRARGQGHELAELRPWTDTDPIRAINWRASARVDGLWVTDRQAERNGDLVLVIDSLLPSRSGEEPAVAAAVRIAAALVEAYGSGRYRLGLVSLTGSTRWFGLEGGRFHQHRLLAAIMATQASVEPIWLAVDRVLQRAARPPSLMAFVSPLMDDRLVGRIGTLARTEVDTVVIAVDIEAWLPPPATSVQTLARRLWRLERESTIQRLRGAGVGAGVWQPDGSLTGTMEEVEQWRRHARQARI